MDGWMDAFPGSNLQLLRALWSIAGEANYSEHCFVSCSRNLYNIGDAVVAAVEQPTQHRRGVWAPSGVWCCGRVFRFRGVERDVLRWGLQKLSSVDCVSTGCVNRISRSNRIGSF